MQLRLWLLTKRLADPVCRMRTCGIIVVWRWRREVAGLRLWCAGRVTVNMVNIIVIYSILSLLIVLWFLIKCMIVFVLSIFVLSNVMLCWLTRFIVVLGSRGWLPYIVVHARIIVVEPKSAARSD